MNSKIVDLAKQAGWSGFDALDERNQKFAYLIIQECCNYLSKESERLYALSASERRGNFKEDFESCAEKCLDNILGIKEHFGVSDEF